ncbi:MAG: hypothetical protein ACYTF7_04395 [Planctomycetota bacterium]|jgi:hypothetical protein
MDEHAPKLSRRLIVVGVILTQGVLVWCLWLLMFVRVGDGPPIDDLKDLLSQPGWWAFSGSVAGVVMVLSGVIMFPARRPSSGSERGSSLFLSVLVASLCAGGLALGVLYLLVELLGLWEHAWDGGDVVGWMLLLAFVPGWLLYTPLLWSYSKGKSRDTFVGRVSIALFTGSVIEVLAAIPLDVMVRRRTDCYCAESTFLTLLWAGTIGLIAMGPAVVVPVVTRRRKRWYAGRCEWCGYDMTRTLDAERCPECGLGWRSRQKSGTGVSHEDGD